MKHTEVPPKKNIESSEPISTKLPIEKLFELHGHFIRYASVEPDVLDGWELPVMYVIEVRKYRGAARRANY